MKQYQRLTLVLFMMFISLLCARAQDSTAKPAVKPKLEKSKQIKSKTADTKGKDIVVIETSMGTIEAQLYPADAPKTVENFEKLAAKKYFDGMRVHRIAKNFVIQTGDD